MARKIDFDDGSDNHISEEDEVCGVEGLRPLPESPEKLKENVMPPILTREAIDRRRYVILHCLHKDLFIINLVQYRVSHPIIHRGFRVSFRKSPRLVGRYCS